MENIYVDMAWKFLRKEKFKKKKKTFYREFGDVIVILDFQKSDYANDYYINFAIWLKSIAAVVDASLIKQNNCHISARLERVLPLYAKTIIELMDFSRLSSVEKENLEMNFPDVLGEDMRCLINDCSTMEGVKSLLAQGRFDNAMVRKEVKELLL